MRNRAPMQLNFLFKVHNFYLTAISGILLGLFLEQIIPTVARHGIFYAICDHQGGWTDKMVILYYVSTKVNTEEWDMTDQISSTISLSIWSYWTPAFCS